MDHRRRYNQDINGRQLDMAWRRKKKKKKGELSPPLVIFSPGPTSLTGLEEVGTTWKLPTEPRAGDVIAVLTGERPAWPVWVGSKYAYPYRGPLANMAVADKSFCQEDKVIERSASGGKSVVGGICAIWF